MGAQENEEEASAREAKEKRPAHISPMQRRIGEAIVLIAFIAFDFFDVWPRDHLWSLLLGWLGVAGILIAEFPRKWAAFYCGAAAVIAASIYLGEGPTPAAPRAETEYHGWLTPASDAMPPHTCPVEAGDLVVFLGNAFADMPITRTQMTVLQIRSNPLVVMKRGPQGVAVSADVFSAEGNLIARIQDNEFNLAPAQIAFPQRPNPHTLVVIGQKGDTVFSAKFLNPSAVQILGTFFANGIEVQATSSGLSLPGGNVWSGGCAKNSPIAWMLG